MKKNKIAGVVILFAIANSIYADEPLQCDGTVQKPCTVQDTQNNTAQVKHWRNTFLIARKYQGNTAGLDTLWMSGSAEASAQGWKTIAENIKDVTHKKAKKIIDVDLRQESHGYLDQNAVNLTSENDWINRGKTRDESLSAEQNWLQFLSQQKNVPNVLTPEQFKEEAFRQGQDISVESVENEETVVKKAGLQYFRLTVTDHMAPDDAGVDRFVALVKTIKPKSTWLHIHCRGGDGRTTTFMAMYDMLHNADKVSLDDIIKRQAAVVPNYDLFDTTRGHPELSEYYKQREQFLRKFYVYAQASLKDYKGSWSQWLEQNKEVK